MEEIDWEGGIEVDNAGDYDYIYDYIYKDYDYIRDHRKRKVSQLKKSRTVHQIHPTWHQF